MFHLGTYLRSTRRDRRGSAALEELLILTVVFPIAAFCTFLAIKVLAAIFTVISSTVSWPFI